ncbi:MAG: transcription antitermination factor NusB [Chloroflexi bacterium]|nr:transcription antitermination factor NusB [Chloroflexota bacterium]|tara:strand:- start:1145 stop:1606 length:462 start_codon:yes stop_codon:yes gene_type:complete
MPPDKLDTLVAGERISESTPKLTDTRRKARFISIQSLYENEMSGVDINIVTERLLNDENLSKKDQTLCRKIIKTIEKNSNLIDEKISNATLGFDLIEMSSIDRNCLRVAFAESLFNHPPPNAVIINEAIEIASYLGSDSSGSLINGILATLLL